MAERSSRVRPGVPTSVIPGSGDPGAGALPAPRQPSGYVPTLDALRLLAALLVLAFHYGFRGTAADSLSSVPYPELSGAARYGVVGLNLFFLISGFVISYSAQGRDWLAFARARALRLYPGHVVCMTLTALVTLALGAPRYGVTPAQYLANLTMLAPALRQPFMDGAYWSIVLELIFYAYVALALLAGWLPRRTLEIVAVWLLLCAVNQFMLHSHALEIVLITKYGPFFAAGMLLQEGMRRGFDPVLAAYLTAAFLIGLAVAMADADELQHLYHAGLSRGVMAALDVATFALVLAALRWRHLVPGGGRAARLMLVAGGLTYPLYLVHQQAGYILLGRLAPAIGRWPALGLVTMGMLGVAYAVWRLAEPIGRRWLAVPLDALVARLRRALGPRQRSRDAELALKA